MLSYILPFIILILIVVFIHEYGHYYFAKRYGVGVTDFSIGFGQEIFGWNDKSGTRWKICWIPLGGYVKFYGDRNVFSQADQEKIIQKYNEEDRKKLFVLKPLYQRVLIVFGGPLANFLLALVIFFSIYTFVGKDFTPAVINEVQKDSPAMVGGLKNNEDLMEGSYLGTEFYNPVVWQIVYVSMAGLMLIGVLTTLCSPEPNIKRKNNFNNISDQLKFLLTFAFAITIFIFCYSIIDNPFNNKEPLEKFLFALLRIVICFASSSVVIYMLIKIRLIPKKSAANAYIKPISEFISRYGKTAIFILLLIGFYRIADIVMGVVANIFYLEKGFNVKEIATYSKFFGVFATIIGGLIGGYSAVKFGTIKALFFGAVIAAASNLLFSWLAVSEPSINALIIVITADNISSGFAGAAFVVYLSALTSIKFTATQYALFSSLMILFPKVIAGYSGSMVNFMGYSNFYIFTAILGVPVLILIIWIAKLAPVKE